MLPSLLVVLATSGCGLILGLDEDATLITTTGQDPTICASLCDDGDPCTYDRCVGETTACAHEPVADGPAPNESQTAGDCQVVSCSAGRATQLVDPEDPPEDTPCAAGTCVDGEPLVVAYEAGTLCPEGFCDGTGNCQQCLDNEDCAFPETCGGGGEPFRCGCTAVTCADLGLSCGFASDGCHAILNCNDNSKNGGETDIDCGGSVGSCVTRCALAKNCGFGTDCASGHCGGGKCTLAWSEGYGDEVAEHASAIATDSDDNILLAGSFAGAIRFGTQDLLAPDGEVHAYLAMLDPGGAHRWSHSFGATGSIAIHDVAADGAGNAVAVGTFQGSLTVETTTLVSGAAPQGFILKFDDQGFLLWAKQLVNVPASSGWSGLQAVAVDSANRIWLGGDGSGDITIDGVAMSSFDATDALLVGLTSGGAVHFATLFGQQGVQRITSVATGLNDDVAIVGDFNGSLVLSPGSPVATKGSFDAFVARLDNNGAMLWWRAFGGPSEQHAVSTAFDVHGNVIVGGNFFGELDDGATQYPSAGSQDVFVMQLRAMTGDNFWTNVYGDASVDHLAAVSSDVVGDVSFTGHFAGTLSLGGTTLVSAGGNDVFLAKLDNSGGPHWLRGFGDADAQNGVDLAVTPTGTLCVTGDFRGSIDFGQGPFSAAGSDDVFVASLGPFP